MKTCRVCKITKDFQFFYSKKSCKDGFAGICKDCDKARASAWFQNNKERAVNSRKEWAKKNPDLVKKYDANCYRRYSERFKELDANRYQMKRESILIKQRERYYTRPDKAQFIAAKNAERRAREKAAGGSHTAEDLLEMLKKQLGKCQICRVDLNGKFEADHIRPLSKEGTNDICNIQLLCRTCNRRKGAKWAA